MFNIIVFKCSNQSSSSASLTKTGKMQNTEYTCNSYFVPHSLCALKGFNEIGQKKNSILMKIMK